VTSGEATHIMWVVIPHAVDTAVAFSLQMSVSIVKVIAITVNVLRNVASHVFLVGKYFRKCGEMCQCDEPYTKQLRCGTPLKSGRGLEHQVEAMV